jgi:hypothetical protein
VLLPLSIELEDVKSVLRFELVIQTGTVCNLIFLLHEVQFLLDRWVILVPILAYLEEHFDHVLHTLIDIGLV